MLYLKSATTILIQKFKVFSPKSKSMQGMVKQTKYYNMYLKLIQYFMD